MESNKPTTSSPDIATSIESIDGSYKWQIVIFKPELKLLLIFSSLIYLI